MPPLDPLPPADDIFDYRGVAGADDDAPPVWLPHHQGDVFTGVSVPGIDEPGDMAMLFLHPCTMRRGATLKPQTTVICVRPTSRKKVVDRADHWASQFSVMPLPDLLGRHGDTHAADFMLMGTVRSELLDRTNRVATLSTLGRGLLQQRIIHHLTRYCPRLDELAAATATVQTEIELQSDWVEASCQIAGDEDAATVAAAEATFEEFMTAEGRRARLAGASETTLVVMETQRAIRALWPPGSA
jgi:hypothetical protein